MVKKMDVYQIRIARGEMEATIGAHDEFQVRADIEI